MNTVISRDGRYRSEISSFKYAYFLYLMEIQTTIKRDEE